MQQAANKTLSEKASIEEFVNWFRSSAPYIHSHRNRTFVIFFGGEALLDKDFTHLIHDVALLNSLGIRLVLVYGIRPQIDQALARYQQVSQFHRHLRITDDTALECVKEAAGKARVEIEALLSMGLTNSPMSGAKIKVTSGNFVTAQPIGVLGGVDHIHTGRVRKIDSDAIHQLLNQYSVVLISPIGYSPSGEVFNLCAEKVATECAIALKADKLVLLTEHDLNIAQMTTSETLQFLTQNPNLPNSLVGTLQAALQGCQNGVKRAHLIDRNTDGAVLLELFSRNGFGTLISATVYEALRPANLNDIGGILELITPLEQKGILIKRSREKLEMEIGDYFVIEIDGMIIGCAALHAIAETSGAGLISCVAVHPDYQQAQRGNHLLENLQIQAKQQKIHELYALSTQTMQWFTERGFKPVSIEDLPESLQTQYCTHRNSKALLKVINHDR